MNSERPSIEVQYKQIVEELRNASAKTDEALTHACNACSTAVNGRQFNYAKELLELCKQIESARSLCNVRIPPPKPPP